jgi:hypothetical protein
MNAILPTSLERRQWFIVRRWQEYDGESRANLLRIVSIGAFYVLELARFYVFENARAEHLPFHRQATAIAVAWSMAALAVMLCLKIKMFPAALKYLSTAADVLLLTALAAITGDPSSPLILAYLLIMALTALRFSRGLIAFATIACMLAYLGLVGLADAKTSRWFDAEHAVPPVTQSITLLTLALTGLVLGQATGQARRMAGDYALRLAAAEKTA